jgi:hypothetical protein
MCLITEQKRAGVLKKDMKVYKVVRKNDETYCSPIQSFEWKWDLLYETNMGIIRNVVYPSIFFGGKYSFTDKAAAEGYSGFMRRLTIIYEGFHAYMAPERANLNDWFEGDKLIILCFTIPAGAKVFRDATGLIVSDKMILKREDNEN